MRRKKKKPKKEPTLIGLTVGGPAPGIRFVADYSALAHVVLLPKDPVYCAASYTYFPQLTALGEMIAKFSHCIKREKPSAPKEKNLEILRRKSTTRRGNCAYSTQ